MKGMTCNKNLMGIDQIKIMRNSLEVIAIAKSINKSSR